MQNHRSYQSSVQKNLVEDLTTAGNEIILVDYQDAYIIFKPKISENQHYIYYDGLEWRIGKLDKDFDPQQEEQFKDPEEESVFKV